MNSYQQLKGGVCSLWRHLVVELETAVPYLQYLRDIYKIQIHKCSSYIKKSPFLCSLNAQ